MRAHSLVWVLCLAMVASSGCKDSVQEILPKSVVTPNVFPERAAALLRRADTLQVLSLDPGTKAKTDSFHDWAVLGTVSIPDADRKTLVEAIIAGVAPSDAGVASCFDPRHGLHAVAKDITVDLVICFECNRVSVFYSDGDEDFFMPSYNLARPLSKILNDAGIPIALTMSERIEQGSRLSGR